MGWLLLKGQALSVVSAQGYHQEEKESNQSLCWKGLPRICRVGWTAHHSYPPLPDDALPPPALCPRSPPFPSHGWDVLLTAGT